jgi:hypothetical protein
MNMVTALILAAALIEEQSELVPFSVKGSNVTSCGDFVGYLRVAESSTVSGGKAIVFMQHLSRDRISLRPITVAVTKGVFELRIDDTKLIPTIANAVGGPLGGYHFIVRANMRDAGNMEPCLIVK